PDNALMTGWPDLDKAQVPQADEQMRLFANLVTYIGQQATPLPRLWYFPAPAQKSIVIVTGDDHGQINSIVQPFISTVEQRGGRMTFYLSRYGNITGAALQAWKSAGHEFGMHPWGHD